MNILVKEFTVGSLPAWLMNLFIVLLALISLSCAAGKKTKNDLPDWVSNPPRDSGFKIYGIGAGKDFQESKQSALADIAGKINTRVSEQVRVQASLNAGKTGTSMNSDTRSEVSPTQLNNYQIVNSIVLKDVFWTLLALSIPDFSRDQEEKIIGINKQLQLLHKRYEKYSAFQKYLLTQEFLKPISQAEKILSDIEALTSIKRAEDYKKLYQDYKIMLAANNDSLSIEIRADQNAEALGEYMVELIADAGIRIHAGGLPEAGTILELKTSYSSEEKNQAYQLKLKTCVSLLARNQEVISRANYLTIVKSTKSEEHALNMAAKKLSIQLKSKGLKAAVGIKD